MTPKIPLALRRYHSVMETTSFWNAEWIIIFFLFKKFLFEREKARAGEAEGK